MTAPYDTSDQTVSTLYAAASRITNSPAEQTWLVMHCIRARHDAAWLDARNPRPPMPDTGRHPAKHVPAGIGLFPDL